MSFDYNYKFWVGTKNDLEDIHKHQEALKTLKPIPRGPFSHFILAELYVSYVQLVNKLGYIYHHIFQVQKRDVVKGLVEAATQRLLELKSELKNIELSEFIYVDDVLVQKKLTPDDVTVWTPKYFPFWRHTYIQEMIDGSKKKLEVESESVESIKSNHETKRHIRKQASTSDQTNSRKASDVLSEKRSTMTALKEVMTREASLSRRYIELRRRTKHGNFIDPKKKKIINAILLIQAHERARVARANLRYNRNEFMPNSSSDSKSFYKFTHKPNQTMLIQVKRTRFDADFYIKKRNVEMFSYYVKPIYQQVTALSEEYNNDTEEEESSGWSIRDRFLSLFDDSDNVTEDTMSIEMQSVSDTQNEARRTMDHEEFMQKVRNLSAIKIQKNWRAYRDRKKYKALVKKKLILYGMLQEPKPRSAQMRAYEERVQESIKHRLIKERYDDEFIQFCTDERARILRVRGPWIMEDISDNIRDWFKEFYYKVGSFHPYPEAIKGGTLLLLRCETMDVNEFKSQGTIQLSKEQLKKIQEKEKLDKNRKKERILKQQKQLEKRRAMLKAKGIIDMKDNLISSKSVAKIQKIMEDYNREWADIEEKLNRKQDPIKSWITSDLYVQIHQELQLAVDDLMRIEYELLEDALVQDNKNKKKPPEVYEKNKRLPRKSPRKSSLKLRSVPRDITADRSIESLFHELQDAGIIRTYPKRTFDSYIGERNHCAFDMLYNEMKDPPPYEGEIKDILSEYVLGMGPLNISKPKSILLVGPSNCGKRHLCDCLATEIDAVFFDISPENTVQYQSDMKYLIHLILKMAKILQPTILFIHNVHRIFWKNIPPESMELYPTLLQESLQKDIFKHIKNEDKILLLGTSNAPWQANVKMKKLFQKILLVPKTEYASNFMLRRNLTLRHVGVQRDLDISSLAYVTRDYTSGDIIKNIDETLNFRRRMNLTARPLHEMEFIENLCDNSEQITPLDEEEWKKFLTWYEKSNIMAKNREQMLIRLRKMSKLNSRSL